jgi:hypothetical protein
LVGTVGSAVGEALGVAVTIVVGDADGETTTIGDVTLVDPPDWQPARSIEPTTRARVTRDRMGGLPIGASVR